MVKGVQFARRGVKRKALGWSPAARIPACSPACDFLNMAWWRLRSPQRVVVLGRRRPPPLTVAITVAQPVTVAVSPPVPVTVSILDPGVGTRAGPVIVPVIATVVVTAVVPTVVTVTVTAVVPVVVTVVVVASVAISVPVPASPALGLTVHPPFPIWVAARTRAPRRVAARSPLPVTPRVVARLRIALTVRILRALPVATGDQPPWCGFVTRDEQRHGRRDGQRSQHRLGGRRFPFQRRAPVRGQLEGRQGGAACGFDLRWSRLE
eukprot:scaffold15318_cov125-Isochrysis_galbana.AAC.4